LNKKRNLIAFVLFFAAVTVFSQVQEYKKILFVTSEDGLRIRSEPSTGGSRVGSLSFGQRIVTYARTNYTTIDGISAYWYSIDWENKKWVFGGYLSEEFPDTAPVLLGRWDDPDDWRQYYSFSPDHTYGEGYKETGMGFFGKWELTGNSITLHLEHAGTSDEINETVKVQLKIIDKNNIILVFPGNESVRLTRSQDLW